MFELVTESYSGRASPYQSTDLVNIVSWQDDNNLLFARDANLRKIYNFLD
jgi:hypothetical protein